MIWFILLAQLVLSGGTYRDDPKFKEWFEKAKIGDIYGYAIPSGCNTCSGQATKVSNTEILDTGMVSCTLVNCMMGEYIKVK